MIAQLRVFKKRCSHRLATDESVPVPPWRCCSPPETARRTVAAAATEILLSVQDETFPLPSEKIYVFIKKRLAPAAILLDMSRFLCGKSLPSVYK
jgi:hypothetical protein